MPTTAYTGPGFAWKVDNGTGAFITIAYCRDIKGPTLSRSMPSIANQSSPSNTDEVKPALISSGVISTTLVFNPGDLTQRNLIASLQAGTLNNFQIYNNPPINTLYWSGQGYFSKFEPTSPYNGVQEAAIELTITGPATQN